MTKKPELGRILELTKNSLEDSLQACLEREALAQSWSYSAKHRAAGGRKKGSTAALIESRISEVVGYVVSGLGTREILQKTSESWKISERSISAYVSKAREIIGELSQDDREMALSLELQRLDRLLSAIWTSAMQGSFKAVDSALRISERRSKLLGLDCPTKIAATTASGEDVENPYLTMSADQLREVGKAILHTAITARDEAGLDSPDVARQALTNQQN